MVEALRANIGSKSAISLQRGPADPKFQVEAVAPPTILLLRKLGDLRFSYDIKIWTDLSSVLSQFTRLTDRQTDGKTDRRTAFSSPYRIRILCSAVKNEVYKNGYRRRSCTSKTAIIYRFVRFVMYYFITTVPVGLAFYWACSDDTVLTDGRTDGQTALSYYSGLHCEQCEPRPEMDFSAFSSIIESLSVRCLSYTDVLSEDIC